jgi:carbonic anhydrase
MPNFAAGVVRFQNEVFPAKRAFFEELSLGQSPEAFFLTCSDSRIETAMITQSQPGDLFICRNAGNIVPPHSTNTGGITASLEYAVSVLKVPHIVICGHTNCGAMQSALSGEGLDDLPHVKQWLSFSKAAVDVVNALGTNLSPESRMQMLLEKNVILQIQHLKTHPSVAVRLAKSNLQLHGWVYDIKTGEVLAYDEGKDQFSPVDQHYAAEMAALATHDNCTFHSE